MRVKTTIYILFLLSLCGRLNSPSILRSPASEERLDIRCERLFNYLFAWDHKNYLELVDETKRHTALPYHEKVKLARQQHIFQSADALLGAGLNNHLFSTLLYQHAKDGPITGDLFWGIKRADGSRLLLLGDVEGHGDYAALTTIDFHQQLNNAIHKFANLPTPKEILDSIDENLSFKKTNIVLAALIISSEGNVQFAGGVAPLLKISSTGAIDQINTVGGYIGREAPFNYRTTGLPGKTFQMNPGDRLLWSTDGLYDSNPYLQELIHRNPDVSSYELKKRIIETIPEIKDDITFFIFDF